MKTEETKLRFVPDCIEVRESQDGTESRTIQGRAIVFNEETTLWDGKYFRDREIIERSCVTPEFLREQDVKLNAMHDRTMTVAPRNNKGVGTLQMEVREDGVLLRRDAEVRPWRPNPALVRNKTFTGCSFEFRAGEWTEDKKTLEDGREDTLYKHTKFKSLNALTIALTPAYKSTSVSEREEYEQRENDRAAQEQAKPTAKSARQRKPRI